MIVERVTDTLIMATIVVIIISGNGFIELTLRLYFVESAITTTRLHHVYLHKTSYRSVIVTPGTLCHLDAVPAK
jgi:hypothetical protein